jgi:putative endonuclease
MQERLLPLFLFLFFDVILSEPEPSARDFRVMRWEAKDLLLFFKPITFDIQTSLNPHISMITMRERCYYAYIVASRSRVIYVGVTNNIERRLTQHKERACEGFTATYHCDRLVWFQRYNAPAAAIAREKELKGWRRSRKIELIQRENPTWVDLSEDWGKPIKPSSP